jgi:ferredoxin
MSRITVDEDLCIGSETCVTRHPEAFRIGDRGTAEVLPDERQLSDEERRALAESCPAAALRLTPR